MLEGIDQDRLSLYYLCRVGEEIGVREKGKWICAVNQEKRFINRRRKNSDNMHQTGNNDLRINDIQLFILIYVLHSQKELVACAREHKP